jgi:hypothetical protein
MTGHVSQRQVHQPRGEGKGSWKESGHGTGMEVLKETGLEAGM